MEPIKGKSIPISHTETDKQDEKISPTEKKISTAKQLEHQSLSLRHTLIATDVKIPVDLILVTEALENTSKICSVNGSDNLRKNKKDTSRTQIMLSGMRRRFSIIHGEPFPYKFNLEEYAKEIERIKVGNCLEQSLYAAQFLIKRGVTDLRVIKFGDSGEHACLLVGTGYGEAKKISELKNVLVCDPWSGIACKATEYRSIWESKMRLLATDYQVFLNKWISTDHPKWLAVPELRHEIIASWLITSGSR